MSLTSKQGVTKEKEWVPLEKMKRKYGVHELKAWVENGSILVRKVLDGSCVARIPGPLNNWSKRRLPETRSTKTRPNRTRFLSRQRGRVQVAHERGAKSQGETAPAQAPSPGRCLRRDGISTKCQKFARAKFTGHCLKGDCVKRNVLSRYGTRWMQAGGNWPGGGGGRRPVRRRAISSPPAHPAADERFPND